MKNNLAKFVSITLVCAFAILDTACVSTVAMRQGKVIDKKGNILTRSYLQEGKAIDIMDMYDKLSKVQISSDKASTGKIIYYSALGGGVVGGLYVLQGFTNSSQLTTGILITGISFAAYYYADVFLSDAVDLYNGSLGYRRKRGDFKFNFAPQFNQANNSIEGGQFLAKFEF